MRPSSIRLGFLSSKSDGFRAVAYVESGACRLVSRNRNAFKTFELLAQAIAQDIAGRSVILDGEIVPPGPDGRPMFYELIRRRGPFCFYAFDLLWLDGRDLPDRPLLEGESLLRKLLPLTSRHFSFAGRLLGKAGNRTSGILTYARFRQTSMRVKLCAGATHSKRCLSAYATKI
jgi:ATP-dependent DNA ligase